MRPPAGPPVSRSNGHVAHVPDGRLEGCVSEKHPSGSSESQNCLVGSNSTGEF